MRLEQYADQVKRGLFNASGNPAVQKTDKGAWIVDGNGGFGITALKTGVQKVILFIHYSYFVFRLKLRFFGIIEISRSFLAKYTFYLSPFLK